LGGGGRVSRGGAVRPIAELVVDDAMRHLEDYAGRALLRIYRYPSRPPDIPTDDEDLVPRGIVWTREKGDITRQATAVYYGCKRRRRTVAVKATLLTHKSRRLNVVAQPRHAQPCGLEEDRFCPTQIVPRVRGRGPRGGYAVPGAGTPAHQGLRLDNRHVTRYS